MRKLLLLSAAAAIAAVAPTLADAQNQGKGKKAGAAPSLGILGKQLAPGGAGQLFGVGQQVPAAFNNFTALSSLPAPIRGLLPSGFNYIQQGNSIAVVDPASRIVRQIIPIPR